MNAYRWVVLCIGAVGLGLILVSHWVHALGVLPYLVLLACPVLHLFHGEHQHGHTLGEAPRSSKEINL
jgi:hypothetical protein